jgi:hypothetical protein
MRTRPHNIVVKVDADELAKLHALADAADEHASRLVRRWIAQQYEARFGDVAPRPRKRSR